MTDYEVLGLDQWDSKSSLSQTTSPSESESTPIMLSLTPQSTPPSTPSPPPSPEAPEQPEEVGKGVEVASSSPQLRLMKRRAPEVHSQQSQLLPSSECPERVVVYSPVY